MPELTPLTLQDRETTPVDHVFTPVNKNDNGIAYFAERGDTRLHDKLFSISSRDTPSGIHKVTAKLSIPIVSEDTSSGVTINDGVRTSRADINLSCDEDATIQEMKNTVGMLHAALAESQTFLDVIFTGRETPY
jgi:hypothetical protein